MDAVVYDNKGFKNAIYERFGRDIPFGGNIILSGLMNKNNNSGYSLKDRARDVA